jgi:DNA-binding Xre family transcriptional regulator
MANLIAPQDRLGKAKEPVEPMSESRRLEVAAQLTDDVLSKLVDAFFQVVQQEGWGKRDLSSISGIDETAIGHILAGRRKNVTLETIALLTRAMRKRPELTLHDLRPVANNRARLADSQPETTSAASALEEKQVRQSSTAPAGRVASATKHEKLATPLFEVVP